MNDDSDLDWKLERGLPPRRDIPENVRERIKSAVEEGIAAPNSARGSWLRVAAVAAAIVVATVFGQVLPNAMRQSDGPADSTGPATSQRNHLDEQTKSCSLGYDNPRRGASIPAAEHPGYAQVLMTRNDRSATVCYDYLYNGPRKVFNSAEECNYVDVNEEYPVGIQTISPGAEDFRVGPKRVFIAGITTDQVGSVLFIPPHGKPARAFTVDGTFVVRTVFDAEEADVWHVESYDRSGRLLARGTLAQYDHRFGS